MNENIPKIFGSVGKHTGPTSCTQPLHIPTSHWTLHTVYKHVTDVYKQWCWTGALESSTRTINFASSARRERRLIFT